MQIRLLCIGRIRTTATRGLVDDFLQRLGAYHTVEEIELRATMGKQPEHARQLDSTNVLAQIDRSDRLWLLDREGTEWSSPDLAQYLAEEERHGKGRISVVIGGAYGFDGRVRERADVCWSLSKLTFLHEWARAIVIEQLYRATKILRNEPYHH